MAHKDPLENLKESPIIPPPPLLTTNVDQKNPKSIFNDIGEFQF